MKLNKGFTLIELLVVIAIIGILSSVVLASLTTARARGQAAAVQSQLSNMRAQAELYYSTNNNKYAQTDQASVSSANCSDAATLFAGPTNGLTNLINGAASTLGGVTNLECAATAGAWFVRTKTAVSNNYYCVDNTGQSTSSLNAFTNTYGNKCS